MKETSGSHQKMQIPEYETKSVPHELARGAYVKYRNTRTNEIKMVRDQGDDASTKSMHGMDDRWAKL